MVATVACTGHSVTVSGVNDTVVLVGQCEQVAVSGVRNTITVESAHAIAVSGFDNRIRFGGEPAISNSGSNNVVEPR